MATRPKGITPPNWLTGDIAKDYYRRRYKELQPLTYGQQQLLAKVAAEHESYVSLQRAIDELASTSGLFVSGSNGNMVAHPSIALQQKAADSLRKFETLLRISLKGPEQRPQSETVSRIDDFMNEEI